MEIESAGREGTGLLVNTKGQALTQSLIEPRVAEATIDGKAFYLHSGFISLTTAAGFSGALFLRNDSQNKLSIHSIRTCGTVVQQWEMYRNPTAGTLISGGTAKTPQNLNFSSGGVFNGTVLAGVDGHTVTDGDLMAHWINDVGHSTELLQGAMLLGLNNTLALKCKPATNGEVCIAILASFRDTE